MWGLKKEKEPKAGPPLLLHVHLSRYTVVNYSFFNQNLIDFISFLIIIISVFKEEAASMSSCLRYLNLALSLV